MQEEKSLELECCVYAVADDCLNRTKIGCSEAPIKRLKAFKKNFGEHLYLKNKWTFPDRGQAFKAEQYVLHEIHYGLGVPPIGRSEWFTNSYIVDGIYYIEPIDWIMIFNLLDRAEQQSKNGISVETWIIEEDEEAYKKYELHKLSVTSRPLKYNLSGAVGHGKHAIRR